MTSKEATRRSFIAGLALILAVAVAAAIVLLS
jgi:hypothetical protein